MKTRYKISLVILGTVIFYFVLQFLGFSCRTFLDDCFIFHELAYYSSIVIPVELGDENGIGNWTGTAQGIEPRARDYFTENRSFIFFYIIIPTLIISAIIFKDKRKRK